jgi:hypothetical protein
MDIAEDERHARLREGDAPARSRFVQTEPAAIETFGQSIFMPAVLSRNRSALDPSAVTGNPPKKSTLRSPAVLAPPTRGPNTSSPRYDWRTLAPKLPPDDECASL